MRDHTLNMDEIIERNLKKKELMISGKQLGKMLWRSKGVSEEERENFLAAYQTKIG